MASIILMQSYIVVSYVGGFLEDDRQDYVKRLVLSLVWLVVIVQPSCLTAVALAQVLMKNNTSQSYDKLILCYHLAFFRMWLKFIGLAMGNRITWGIL